MTDEKYAMMQADLHEEPDEETRQFHPMKCEIYDAILEACEMKDKKFQDAVNKAMKYLEKTLQLTEAESTHIRKLFNF